MKEIKKRERLVKSGQVIPENELWLHTPEVRAALDQALAWSASHPPKRTNLAALERRLRSAKGRAFPRRHTGKKLRSWRRGAHTAGSE